MTPTNLGQPLLQALQRVCCGGVLLDQTGNVLHINRAAEEILVSDSKTGPEHIRQAIKQLLRAPSKRLRVEGDTWVVIRREGGRELVLHSMQIANGVADGPHSMVILIDLQRTPLPNAQTLQDIFGLTGAEAGIAIQLVAGETLADIASMNRVKIATARAQLASIFAKTRTKRPAQLVALLARVAVLP